MFVGHGGWKVGIAIALMSCLVTGCGQNSAKEKVAIDKLKELKAIVIPGPDRKHAESVMIRQNLDEALPLLKDLSWLKILNLSGTAIDDQSVKHLLVLNNLQSLDIANSKVTDAGIRDLANLPLDSLVLANVGISAESVDVLSGISQLKILDLTGCQVQSNLAPLKKLKRLNWLLVGGMDLSKVSKEAVETFIAIPNLRKLTVTGANLSEEDLRAIKSGKPTVTIDLGASTTPIPPSSDTTPHGGDVPESEVETDGDS